MKKTSPALASREWLTLADAAKYFSAHFKEEFGEIDVLQLAISKKLTLSFRISKEIPFRRLTLIEYKGADYEYANLEELKMGRLSEEQVKSGIELRRKMLQIGKHYWRPGNEITFLSGLFDLPFTGGEERYIDLQYRLRLGEPPIPVRDPCHLRLGGVYLQVMRDRDEDETVEGSNAEREKIDRIVRESNLDATLAEYLFRAHREKRHKFRESDDRFVPARELPFHGQLVVRPKSIEEFLNGPGGTPESSDTISTHKRNTYLVLIAALCSKAGIDPQQRGASSVIKQLCEELGTPVGDDTIREILKQVPAAIEARSSK